MVQWGTSMRPSEKDCGGGAPGMREPVEDAHRATPPMKLGMLMTSRPSMSSGSASGCPSHTTCPHTCLAVVLWRTASGPGSAGGIGLCGQTGML